MAATRSDQTPITILSPEEARYWRMRDKLAAFDDELAATQRKARLVDRVWPWCFLSALVIGPCIGWWLAT